MLTVAVRAHETATGRPLGPVERERLTTLYETHHQLAWRVLRRSGLDRSRADDGVQQVFLVVLRRLAEIDDGRARAFICGCSVMVARKMRQGLARETVPLSAALLETAASPDQHAEHKQRVALLDALLSQLDEELRAVFVLQVVEGLTKRETAVALTIPEGTVATRLRRARAEFDRLHRKLTGGEP